MAYYTERYVCFPMPYDTNNMYVHTKALSENLSVHIKKYKNTQLCPETLARTVRVTVLVAQQQVTCLTCKITWFVHRANNL